jgi:hypothetical protein
MKEFQFEDFIRIFLIYFSPQEFRRVPSLLPAHTSIGTRDEVPHVSRGIHGKFNLPAKRLDSVLKYRSYSELLFSYF